MRQITFLSLVLLIVCGSTSFAQTISNSAPKEVGLLQYKAVGGDILTSDGVKLSEKDLSRILPLNLYTDYRDASSTRRKGFKNTVIGTSLLASGGGMLIYGSILNKTITEDFFDRGTPYIIIGRALTLAGVILDAIGIPMYFTGQHHLKEIVKEYNNGNVSMVKPVVSWGAQEYGYGIALRF